MPNTRRENYRSYAAARRNCGLAGLEISEECCEATEIKLYPDSQAAGEEPTITGLNPEPVVRGGQDWAVGDPPCSV